MANYPDPKISQELAHRFTSHPMGDEQRLRSDAIRRAMKTAAGRVDSLCPGGREKALALTKLEEALMWANASIAREPAKEGKNPEPPR